MAGVKVTDLPSTASAASTDVMYIVDTAVNQSKQIEVGDLLDFESGTWTPTLSGITGACSSATLLYATYTRVGNIVTCGIGVETFLDFSSLTTGEIDFDFPIATTITDNGGPLNIEISAQINSCIKNTKFLFASDSGLFFGAQKFYGTFQYEIN